MTDYLSLWDRWIAFSVLSQEDGKTLLQNLHEEVRAGIEMLGSISLSEMAEIFKGVEFAQKDDYLKAAGPVLIFSCLNGYSLYLISEDVNPLTAQLKDRRSTEKLGELWTNQYRKDQNQPYLDAIDPFVSLILGRIQEIRVNQLLAFIPEVVSLPYKITERLHQSIGWSVYQGFVLGVMEKKLRGTS